MMTIPLPLVSADSTVTVPASAAFTGLPAAERESLFYVAMLAWVGCVADAPEVAAMFGDDIQFRADSFDTDLAGVPGMTFFLGHAGRGGSWPERVRIASSIVASAGQRVAQGIEGGWVMLGQRTSKMTEAEMSELITLAHAFGDQRGVQWSRTSLGRDVPDEVCA